MHSGFLFHRLCGVEAGVCLHRLVKNPCVSFYHIWREKHRETHSLCSKQLALLSEEVGPLHTYLSQVITLPLISSIPQCFQSSSSSSPHHRHRCHHQAPQSCTYFLVADVPKNLKSFFLSNTLI